MKFQLVIENKKDNFYFQFENKNELLKFINFFNKNFSEQVFSIFTKNNLFKIQKTSYGTYVLYKRGKWLDSPIMEKNENELEKIFNFEGVE